MASNHKLTSLIKGRAIAGSSTADGLLTIKFDDGSNMSVKTGGHPPAIPAGGVIRAVRQKDTEFALDLESGGIITITTAEATSSVLMRDKDNRFEYSD